MANGLDFKVECNMNGRVWEPIAAFNIAAAARNYAIECAKAHNIFAYRVKGPRGQIMCDEAYIKGEAVLDVCLGSGKEETHAHV